MATIQDVARKARVSTATVSRVINESGFVSEELKNKVRQALNELDYRPNSFARSLRKKQSYLIGLMISDIANPFFTALVRGVEDVVNDSGFNLILCNTDEMEEKERAYVELLCEKRVDGVIMAPAGHSRGHVEMFQRYGIPVVFVDRELEGVKVDAVLLDNVKGAQLATTHLISLGHRRIGVIAGRPDISTTWGRLEGYRRALHEQGIEFSPDLVVGSDSRIDGGYRGAQALLSLRERPTAIFATNNLVTIGAMKFMKETGVRIPADISIVGFDDFESTSIVDPPLTVVAQPTYQIGQTAATTLVKRVKRKGKQVRRIKIVRLEPELVIRQSCGARM
ncbi:MAG: LacI family DNA-binding transcriptional regulator [Betaproteobacteria bacterium]